ncbi:actin [Anaeramoeba flamelloides]|uniref:Actin n=1 Tax=Anaeramoeba flamelloides TaxID=1746091 RepID=A0AAV8A5J9_9EUKA|nr:actin [Anaeramoeba flamelloides]
MTNKGQILPNKNYYYNPKTLVSKILSEEDQNLKSINNEEEINLDLLICDLLSFHEKNQNTKQSDHFFQNFFEEKRFKNFSFNQNKPTHCHRNQKENEEKFQKEKKKEKEQEIDSNQKSLILAQELDFGDFEEFNLNQEFQEIKLEQKKDLLKKNKSQNLKKLSDVKNLNVKKRNNKIVRKGKKSRYYIKKKRVKKRNHQKPKDCLYQQNQSKYDQNQSQYDPYSRKKRKKKKKVKENDKLQVFKEEIKIMNKTVDDDEFKDDIIEKISSQSEEDDSFFDDQIKSDNKNNNSTTNTTNSNKTNNGFGETKIQKPRKIKKIMANNGHKSMKLDHNTNSHVNIPNFDWQRIQISNKATNFLNSNLEICSNEKYYNEKDISTLGPLTNSIDVSNLLVDMKTLRNVNSTPKSTKKETDSNAFSPNGIIIDCGSKGLRACKLSDPTKTIEIQTTDSLVSDENKHPPIIKGKIISIGFFESLKKKLIQTYNVNFKHLKQEKDGDEKGKQKSQKSDNDNKKLNLNVLENKKEKTELDMNSWFIIDSIVNTIEMRNKIAKKLFVDLNAERIYFMNQEILALYQFDVKTSLIVNVSTTVSVIPIINETIFTPGIKIASEKLGVQALLKYFELLLKRKALELKKIFGKKKYQIELNRLFVSQSWVSPDPKNQKVIKKKIQKKIITYINNNDINSIKKINNEKNNKMNTNNKKSDHNNHNHNNNNNNGVLGDNSNKGNGNNNNNINNINNNARGAKNDQVKIIKRIEISLGSELFQCMEPLFNPKILDINENGIIGYIIESIKKTPFRIRGQLLNNIILTGGVSKTRGFKNRLKIELEKYFNQRNFKIRILSRINNSDKLEVASRLANDRLKKINWLEKNQWLNNQLGSVEKKFYLYKK